MVTRPVHRRSLRRILHLQEAAFLALVLITGGIGLGAAYFWQQTSAESVRLNAQRLTAQEIRSDMYRQINEVARARLRDDPSAIPAYEAILERIKANFNDLRRRSLTREEDYGIQAMQSAYGVIQLDMRAIFDDPYELNRMVRLKVLDPEYESAFLSEFEDALEGYMRFLAHGLERLEAHTQYWSRMAPWLLPLPVVLAVGVLVLARRALKRQFVEPMSVMLAGAERMRHGALSEKIPVAGVTETAAIADSLNRLSADLAESQAALVESEKQAALGALVPVVAHNIRNPLASIRATSQLIDASDSEEELRETRQAIVSTVDRLERWVSALVSYLHPLKPNLRQVPLAEVVGAAAELLSERAKRRGVALQQAPWDAETVVDVDPDLMEQALYGVMSNALEATPSGGTIRIGVYRDAQRAMLTITDQGPGMPFMPEPSGLSPGPTTKRFGTGLGIPVAYKVARAHGWDVTYSDAKGGGTVVTVSAPLGH